MVDGVMLNGNMAELRPFLIPTIPIGVRPSTVGALTDASQYPLAGTETSTSTVLVETRDSEYH